MPSWLPRVLDRIHKLAAAGKIRLTVKALAELRGLELGLGVADVVDVLVALTQSDSAGRFRSSVSSEWLYVFKPGVAETTLYVKVVLRSDCVVVSFHKDESNEEVS
ncbi:MAG: type II toxin-antitoxin system MqsR family toxin [Deltaproteobacteria bacterium]|nr:type II toxin-antitoxin system MqsR family toxin [Deltaproteobacteria bacterium]